jgi:hypothetical protein
MLYISELRSIIGGNLTQHLSLTKHESKVFSLLCSFFCLEEAPFSLMPGPLKLNRFILIVGFLEYAASNLGSYSVPHLPTQHQ